MGQVRVLRVVVACPSDVAAEREAVVRAPEEVSRNLAEDRGVMLRVLLIGIFWKHFGTPTADAQSRQLAAHSRHRPKPAKPIGLTLIASAKRPWLECGSTWLGPDRATPAKNIHAP